MNAGTTRRSITAGEIAEILDAVLLGDANRTITGVDVVDRAGDNDLSFVGDAKNLPRVKLSKCKVIIAPLAVRDELSAFPDRTFLLVPEAETALLSIAGVLRPMRARPRIGISSAAVVDPTAQIGANTNIHPLAVIGRDVVMGHSCEIHSGVVIGDGCVLGDNVVLHANTVLYHDIIVGSHVTIHAACVIGADGFGYRFVNGGHERLPHYGTVRICDNVEIGAGTTIDRAKIGETVIGTGTRIDNQVMIAHNCQIGRHNLLVSQVGFAGSVTTGDYVVCAGQVGIADHVHLGDGAIIGAKAGVHRDMPGGQTYLGSPAGPVAETTRQLMALRRLPEIRDTVRKMEKELEGLRVRLQDSAAPAKSDNKDSAAA
ncbi:MAG: UDP-3-O-(3-hydroxymyristoyl)glucosamine N-acyltransferase [Planctomycetaceae bacterium]